VGSSPLPRRSTGFRSGSPRAVSSPCPSSRRWWQSAFRTRRPQGVPNIGVSVLGEAHNDAARTLAAKTGDRFAGLDLTTTEQGAVFIEGATAWLDTTIDQQVPAGDHLIVLLRIHSLKVQSDIDPIIFHGSKFRKLQA
jgi:hypothetical protein